MPERPPSQLLINFVWGFGNNCNYYFKFLFKVNSSQSFDPVLLFLQLPRVNLATFSLMFTCWEDGIAGKFKFLSLGIGNHVKFFGQISNAFLHFSPAVSRTIAIVGAILKWNNKNGILVTRFGLGLRLKLDLLPASTCLTCNHSIHKHGYARVCWKLPLRTTRTCALITFHIHLLFTHH